MQQHVPENLPVCFRKHGGQIPPGGAPRRAGLHSQQTMSVRYGEADSFSTPYSGEGNTPQNSIKIKELRRELREISCHQFCKLGKSGSSEAELHRYQILFISFVLIS
jgi:hypothetical protein